MATIPVGTTPPAFRMLPPTHHPRFGRLFWLIQMEVLSRLAGMLAREEESRMWAAVPGKCWKKCSNGCLWRPSAAFSGLEMERVENDSLILYLPILLGERLPQAPSGKTWSGPSKTRAFPTPLRPGHGKCEQPPLPAGRLLERPPSGPPAPLLLLDGMARCGEWEFVRETARKFCRNGDKKRAVRKTSTP